MQLAVGLFRQDDGINEILIHRNFLFMCPLHLYAKLREQHLQVRTERISAVRTHLCPVVRTITLRSVCTPSNSNVRTSSPETTNASIELLRISCFTAFQMQTHRAELVDADLH